MRAEPILPASMHDEAIKAMLQGTSDNTFWTFRGRGALAALLKRLGLKPGARVGLQAFTCSAVPEGILAAGAQPVYVDIDPTRLTMDPQKARAVAGSLDAIVVQHSYGIMADMGALSEIANNAGIPLIEDCCHTYLSRTRDGARAGSIGDAAFYSLEWGKPLVCGIGGIGTINRAERFGLRQPKFVTPGLRARLQIEAQYLAYRVLYSPALYWPVKRCFHALSRLGVGRSNYTLQDIPAADVNALEPTTVSEEFGWSAAPSVRRRATTGANMVARGAAHSQALAEIYARTLPSFVQLSGLRLKDDVLVRFPLLVDEKDAVLAFAERNRIEASEWYRTPVHPYPAHAAAVVRYEAGMCPEAESMGKRIITLPLNMRTTPAQARTIAAALNRFFSDQHKLRSDNV